MQHPSNLESALLAAKRGYCSLESWLKEHESLECASKALRFLSNAYKQLSDPTFKGRIEDSLLSEVSSKILIAFIDKYAGLMTPEENRSLRTVRSIASWNFVTSEDGASSFTADPTLNFSSDVENEVKVYFNNFYKRIISVDDIVNMMKALKNVSDAKSLNIFNCFIHHLYKECKFSRKPLKTHSHMSAVLLGSLINHNVITGQDLIAALQLVLNALQARSSGKDPTVSLKMFMFGLESLRQFASKPQPSVEFYSELFFLE
mmetsp:Transcript_25527/g.46436  ORF Transcript_25527/g.46436 Transcript_25527/m.46436 type:complete len:261 (-) Transcript_25527:731-1513(-)